jgi:hypothetical protein
MKTAGAKQGAKEILAHFKTLRPVPAGTPTGMANIDTGVYHSSTMTANLPVGCSSHLSHIMDMLMQDVWYAGVAADK